MRITVPPAPSDYLASLLDETDRLAARLAATSASDENRAAARVRCLQATLSLDGSELNDEELAAALSDPRPPASARWPNAHEQPASPSWLTAMDRVPRDAALKALEAAGAAAAFDADDLASAVRSDTREALRQLHRVLTGGLVAPDRQGQLRTSEQAVHDASTGRVLYFTLDPSSIADALDDLEATVSSSAAHPVVLAGIVHVELLRIHPFDAANGRLARAASRLIMHDARLDPLRLAEVEPVLADDPLGYHSQVASTLRRRDMSLWLEYWTESVTEGLRRALRRVTTDGSAASTAPAERAHAFLGTCSDSFTLAEYRDAVGVSTVEARTDIAALIDAWLVERVRGTNGLRFLICAQTQA